MKAMHLYLLVLVLTSATGSGLAQTAGRTGSTPTPPPQPTFKYSADLAGPSEVSLEVDPGTVVSFEVVNMVLSKTYRMKLQTVLDTPAPFDSPFTAKAAPTVCETRLIAPLRQADSEQKIVTLIALRRSGEVSCPGEDGVTVDSLIDQTRYGLPQSRTVSRDRKVLFTVERRSADGMTVEKTWRYEVSGGPKGDWLTSYGFNFMPNGDERFQTVADPGNSSAFVIDELSDREDLDFLPSIYFNWRRTANDAKRLRGGPVFGLGFDPDEPVVFAGWGFDIGTNVTVAFGGAFHKQSRLAGKYDVGQSIASDLDEGQLTEKTHDASLFLGFGFRLNENPFADDDETESE
jgi:hypothetical protein